MAEGARAEQSWLKPMAAIALVKGRHPDFKDARFAIVHYAAAGAIRTRCGHGTVTPDGITSGQERNVEAGTVIRREFWAAFADSVIPLAENWSVAVFAARGVKLSAGPIYTHTVRLVGVEFLEADILKAFDLPPLNALLTGQAPRPVQISRAPPPITPLRPYAPVVTTLREHLDRKGSLPTGRRPTARRRKPAPQVPVSHAEFMEWYGALPESDQAKGYRWIWSEAKKHFRPRHVVRKWSEEIVDGRDRGRKSTG